MKKKFLPVVFALLIISGVIYVVTASVSPASTVSNRKAMGAKKVESAGDGMVWELSRHFMTIE